MYRSPARTTTTPRLRAAGMWALLTVGMLLLSVLTLPEVTALVRAPGPSFNELLVQCCSVAALLAATMLWLAMADVAWAVLRSPDNAVRRPLGPVRSALLAACGLAVVATATTAAAASSDSSDRPSPSASSSLDLSGLPLPDRAEGAAARGPAADAEHRTVRVAPGDSLWSIAADQLGPSATPAEITARWRRIYALNVDAIGGDPDLIVPALVLDLPQH